MSRITLRSLAVAALMVAWGAAFCVSAQAEGRRKPGGAIFSFSAARSIYGEEGRKSRHTCAPK